MFYDNLIPPNYEFLEPNAKFAYTLPLPIFFNWTALADLSEGHIVSTEMARFSDDSGETSGADSTEDSDEEEESSEESESDSEEESEEEEDSSEEKSDSDNDILPVVKPSPAKVKKVVSMSEDDDDDDEEESSSSSEESDESEESSEEEVVPVKKVDIKTRTIKLPSGEEI